MTLIVRARGLCLPALTPATRAALVGPVDVDLHAGEVLAVTGESGCGKTTLLRALARLEARALGTVEYLGAPVAGAAVPAYRRAVMYVPQQSPPMVLGVEESLRRAFVLGTARDKAWDATSAATLFDAVQLPLAALSRKVSELSGGEGSRLSLIRALLTEPRVLLLDEPTAALDTTGRERVEAVLEAWLKADAGRAVVIVTHDPAQAERLSTRALSFDAAGHHHFSQAKAEDAHA